MGGTTSLQQASSRDDPRVELAAARALGTPPHSRQRWLLPANGPDCALSLAFACPDVRVHAYSPDQANFDHLEMVREAVASGDFDALGIGKHSHGTLISSGSYEQLGAILRSYLDAFGPPASREVLRSKSSPDQRRGAVESLVQHPHWRAAFASTFHPEVLAAIQGNSSPICATHIRQSVERGLRRAGAPHNPYLQLLLRGHYRRRDAPPVFLSRAHLNVKTHACSLLEVSGIHRFGLVSCGSEVSHASHARLSALASHLEQLDPGAVVVMRLIQEGRHVDDHFAHVLAFDYPLGERLRRMDRALIHDRILVGRRRRRI